MCVVKKNRSCRNAFFLIDARAAALKLAKFEIRHHHDEIMGHHLAETKMQETRKAKIIARIIREALGEAIWRSDGFQDDNGETSLLMAKIWTTSVVYLKHSDGGIALPQIIKLYQKLFDQGERTFKDRIRDPLVELQYIELETRAGNKQFLKATPKLIAEHDAILDRFIEAVSGFVTDPEIAETPRQDIESTMPPAARFNGLVNAVRSVMQKLQK